MLAEQIKSQVDQMLIEEFEVSEDALTPEASLADDLEIDSLDAVDLVVTLEKQFDCRIDENSARAMAKLGDIYDYIEKQVAAAGGDNDNEQGND